MSVSPPREKIKQAFYFVDCYRRHPLCSTTTRHASPARRTILVVRLNNFTKQQGARRRYLRLTRETDR